MLQAPTQNVTYEAYLQSDDDTQNRYELVNGELITTPPPVIQHLRLVKFLERTLDRAIERLGLAWECFREAGQRVGPDSARLPDLVVVPQQDADALLNQPTVFEQPVLLAVQIVSTNWRDDYLHKLAEFEALGIPEYWIIDYLALGAARYLGSPKWPTFSICQLIADEYQIQTFQDRTPIVSATFPELELTTTQICQAAQP